MAAKKHHYIPVFYQKGFADDENLLWVFDRKLRTYKHLHPKVLCREEDLYAVEPKDGGTKDRRVETHILSPIDNAAAPIIQRLTRGVLLDTEDFRSLVRFIALQSTRLPSFGRAVRKISESFWDEWLRLQFSTEQKAEGALSRLERQTGIPRLVSASSMVKSVVNKRVNAQANASWFISQMFDQANFLAHWLEHSTWTILVASQATHFILCDHPFAVVPPIERQGSVVSYGSPGVTCYFPLNARLCLSLCHGDFGFEYQSADSRTVRTINCNIAANSDRFIMAGSLRQLEFVVE